MTVMTMMTVFWRYTYNQGICHFHRQDRHHRHWDNGFPPGSPACRVRFGRRLVAAAVPPFSYKDVIDDILAIVIIGDKDAVYDILAGIMVATRISF